MQAGRLRAERYHCRVAAWAILALLASATTGGAASEGTAVFHSVAAAPSAAALWVNPAALGGVRLPEIQGEAAWSAEGASPAGWSLVSATEGGAVAFSQEGEDRPGVADWSAVLGRAQGSPGGAAFGTALHWRGGDEERTLDTTLGVLVPVGQALSAGVVWVDAFDADVDGVPRRSSWRSGVAWTPRDLKGRITWDTVWNNGRIADHEHWYGIGFERTRHLRGAAYTTFGGDWSAWGGVRIQNVLVGGTMRRGDFDTTGILLILEVAGSRVSRGRGPFTR